MTSTERDSQKHDIRERTLKFAIRALRAAAKMNENRSAIHEILTRQFVRSSTGIGANVAEADAAHTKTEFIRKMNIARGEASECQYWLRVIAESGALPGSRLTALSNECEQIVKILTAIVKSARK